jgi:MFS family permease
VTPAEFTPEGGAPSIAANAARRRPGAFYGWRIVGGAFLICFVSGGLFSTATVFLKAFTSEFGWSRGEVSGAFALGIVVAGFAAPLWGRIADRRGARSAFVPAALLTAALCLLLSRTSGLATLYVLYAVFAFGSAGIYFVPISVLLASWFVEMRGRAIGLAYTGEGFGILLFTPAAGLLVTTLGWRGTYVLAGMVVLAVIVPIALWIRNRPGDLGLVADGATSEPVASPREPEEGSRAEAGLSLRRALGTRAFSILAVNWVLTTMAILAIGMHLVPLLTDQGISTEAAALAAGAVGGMGILGRLGLGLLAERYATVQLAAGCYLLCAVGVALLWATPSLGTPSLLLYVAVFGIAAGGTWALSPLVVSDLFGVRALGEIFGILGIAATLGGAAGGFGAGLLFDLTGDYDLVLALCMALFVIGAALMLLVRAPRTPPPDPAR